MGAAGLWSGILRSPSGRSNGAEETGREGWTDGLTGLSRDGSLARIAVRRSRQRMLPGIEAPAQSVADLFRHCLRQQPERLPPGCPEHFWRGSPRQRCGGIAAGDDHGEAVPRSGSGGSELARLRDC